MSNKMPLEWHEKTITVYRANYQREKEHLERERQRLLRWEADIIVWDMQIKEAKERGVDGFDRERFLRSQTKRVMAQALPESSSGDEHS